MVRCLCLILLILTALLSGCKGDGEQRQTDADLKRLDAAIDRKDDYDAEKRRQIEIVRKGLATAATLADKYAVYKRLFDEYLKFNPDSAMAYASRCMSTASANGMAEGTAQAAIDRTMVSILQGDYYMAHKMLDSLGSIDSIPEPLRHKAATAFLEFYIRRSALNSGKGGGVSVDEASEYWDRYGSYLNKDDWQTDYYEALMTNRDKRQDLLRHIDAKKDDPMASAMLKYAVALGYARDGDEQRSVHYVIESAINDIEASNKDAQSLVFLVNRALPGLGSERAYRYVMFCTDNAFYYRDMGRSYNIIAAHDAVTDNFATRLCTRSRVLTVIALSLAVAICVIVWLFVRMAGERRRERRLLDEKQALAARLEAMVEQDRLLQKDLLKSNRELAEHISSRNDTFLNVYLLVMKYVKDVQTFKKAVYNLLTVGKIEKAKREAASKSGLERYLKEFYAQFDKAFLLMHPDFPQRFNDLLRDDHKIEMPGPESMTPEMRIYALVSLGLTDSLSIAEFLHYSPQTIYNYRLKVRKGAAIPEKSFALTVAHFYR